MPHLDRREDLIQHCSMATSRDELFCKFAIQNGAWTREEAILFIKHYRATGEGVRFGDWAAAQGAIDATLATRIENTIDQRISGASTIVNPGAASSKAAHKGGAVAARVARRTRRSGGLGIDFQRKPVQSGIFLGSGLLAIGIVFYIIFQFQKGDPPPPILTSNKNGSAGSSAGGTDGSGAADTPVAPTFSAEEITNMTNRIQITITDARGYLRDGKSPIGLRQMRRLREEMGGDLLPPEILGKIDGEIAELLTIIEEIYSESLEELREARASGDEADIQDVLAEIEQMCGSDYRARAEKEGS
ncbi:MAG: hypothetical protein VX404_02745 [Planctomycetota bacterium]|nr:hypothetical protein [Planctomycetota bacterium]